MRIFCEVFLITLVIMGLTNCQKDDNSTTPTTIGGAEFIPTNSVAGKSENGQTTIVLSDNAISVTLDLSANDIGIYTISTTKSANTAKAKVVKAGVTYDAKSGEVSISKSSSSITGTYNFTGTSIDNNSIEVSNGSFNNIAVAAKTNPVITWASPSDITFGNLLSATQLNATANVQGTFIYSPSTGTKLNVGINQLLNVDFTPLDEASYNTLSKTVTINVTPIIINNTIWDVTIVWDASASWHADVDFYADGTIKYDEPSCPGCYTAYGTWTLTGDLIHWAMTTPHYVFDGTIVGNTMSGTYVYGSRTNSWSAIKK